MSRFGYDEVVKISSRAEENYRPGSKAWIISIIQDRENYPMREFPAGTIYTVEYEDGLALDIHESNLEAFNTSEI